MKGKTYIRKAGTKEIDRISAFCGANPSPGSPSGNLASMAGVGCLLKAEAGGQLIGVVGLDLARGAVVGPWVQTVSKNDGSNANSAPRRLLEAAERLAAQYGLTRVSVHPSERSAGFFAERGYAALSKHKGRKAARQDMSRSIIRRTTRFGRLVREIGKELGIPADYGVRHKLALQPEAKKLHSIGKDIYDRPQKMLHPAATAWKRMVRQAKSDGVVIQPVSAFRSVEYQAGLVRRKLEKQQSMAEILAVSAAPGYSEHHTGRAIDVTTPGCAVLEEEFENTAAFEWLCNNARRFGFHLSFPRNNLHGIAYEPWHWCFHQPSHQQR